MVFFFALITEEIIDATVPGGALDTWRRVALPVAAAAGGGAGSALAYVLYLRGGDELSVLARGWPIPGAVDLAFVYIVARTIWKRHPAIPFLLLIGIASNALGILVVELRYPIADRYMIGAAAARGGGDHRRRAAAPWRRGDLACTCWCAAPARGWASSSADCIRRSRSCRSCPTSPAPSASAHSSRRRRVTRAMP